MPLYRVTWDGQDILDYTDERMVLLSPHLEHEVNTAGSLRFVVPPYHTYYNLFTDETMLISDVEVYEDDDLIWFGRPLEMRTDFFKQKEIYCEGGLAFFNDTIQEKATYDSVYIQSFFKSVVAEHNRQVNPSRQFIVGNVTVENKLVYREPKYENTLDVLRGQCLDTNEGYFFVRRVGGQNYIDWVKDMPYSCNQVIEFAENMLNVVTTFDGNDYATCVFPLGGNDENGDPITIANANNGNKVLESPMAQIYGKIVKVLQYNDIDDPYELMSEAQKEFERIQYNSKLIECSAADLHSRDGSKEIFRVGQTVHCYSVPHELEMDLPLSKIELNLDTAAKHITLGIIKKKSLTRITKAKESEYDPDQYTPEDYNPASDVIEDDKGDEWEIVMPEEDGDPITAKRMPIKITVAREPNKKSYQPGEALDFTGLVVNIWTKNKDDEEVIWTNPPRYIDGTVPMAELVFSTKTAPNISEFSIDVIWTYKGKRYHTSLEFNTEEAGDWTANYIMMGTGTLGNNGGRTYAKINPGKTIAVWCVNWSSAGWEGPILISDNKEACVYTVNGSTILQPGGPFMYQGVNFYMNYFWHWDTHRMEGSTSLPVINADPTSSSNEEALFRYMVSRCSLQVIST